MPLLTVRDPELSTLDALSAVMHGWLAYDPATGAALSEPFGNRRRCWRLTVPTQPPTRFPYNTRDIPQTVEAHIVEADSLDLAITLANTLLADIIRLRRQPTQESANHDKQDSADHPAAT